MSVCNSSCEDEITINFTVRTLKVILSVEHKFICTKKSFPDHFSPSCKGLQAMLRIRRPRYGKGNLSLINANWTF